MHYETAINDLIEHIKADKGITQPWRNYALKHLYEAQAHLCMGKQTTYRQAEEIVCTCPEGGIRKSCPVHGGKA